MEKGDSIFLSKLITISLFVAVTALMWDGWWHVSLGRETFWLPPHLFLYGAAIIATLAGLYGLYRNRSKAWRNLFIVLLLIPASAPFDNWWHNHFGVENFSTPWIMWSPPHLVLFTALILSLAFLLSFINKYETDTRSLFGSLVFAFILAVLLGITSPVYPLGPYKLLSFWGGGIVAGTFVGMLVIVSGWVNSKNGTLITGLAFTALYLVQMPIKISPIIEIPPFPFPPGWVVVFSAVIIAVLIDTLKKHSAFLYGSLAGLAYGAIVYGLSRYFIEPQFWYSNRDIAIALLTSLAGGIVFSYLAKFLLKSFYHGSQS